MANVRIRKLLDYLSKQDGAVSTKELATFCGVSERSIRNDLKAIDEWLLSKDLPPLIVINRKGVYLNPSLIDRLPDFEEEQWEEGIHFEAEERKRMILAELLFESGVINSTKLPEKYDVSQSTIVNDMRRVYQWLDENGIGFESRTHTGIRLKDDEINIRRGCFLLLVEMTYPSFTDVLQSEFSYLERIFNNHNLKELTEVLKTHRLSIVEIINQYQHDLNWKLTDDGFINTFLMMLICLIRMKNGCFIEFSTIINEQYNKLYEGIEQISFERFFNLLNIDSPPEVENKYLNMVWHVGNRFVYDCSKSIIKKEEVQDFLYQLEKGIGNRVIWRKEEVSNVSKDLDVFLNKHLLGIKMAFEDNVENDISNWLDEYEVCRQYLKEFISNKCNDNYEPSRFEVIQILLELISCIKATEQESAPKAYTVYVVCSGVMNESRLIKYRLNQLFSNIGTIRCLSYHEFIQNKDTLDYDILLSTLELPEDVKDYYKVSSIATKEEIVDLVILLRSRLLIADQRRIVSEMVDVLMGIPKLQNEQKLMLSMEVAKYLHNKNYSTLNNIMVHLEELLNLGLVEVNVEATTGSEAIQKAGNLLMNQGFITQTEIDSMIDLNNKLHGYSVIDDSVAFPHLLTSAVNAPCASIVTLKKPVPITKGGCEVSILIMLLSNDGTSHIAVIEDIIDLLTNKDNKKRLNEAKTSEEVIQIIREARK